jgi:molybdopterin biosynthesis enzyme
MAEAMAGAAPGDGVLPTGADADTQQPLRRAGQRLRDLDVAILCATKVARVSVREPRVRVISAAPIEAAADVVGPLIAQAVNAAGGAGSLVRTHGDTDALARALQEDDVDAFVTIGGTGEGRRDASVRTLARTGRFELHGMGLRPGETAALGAVDARAALMLPGRLDAALAVWLTAGQYLLRRLTGWQEAQAGHAAKLTRKIVSTIGLVEIVPVAACEGGVEPLASGYFPLQALACAEGWVMVPPESEGYPAGATVEVMPFP